MFTGECLLGVIGNEVALQTTDEDMFLKGGGF